MEKDVCERCRPFFEQMQKRVDELERRLRAYENAHTPPSRLRWQPRRPPSEPKKRGAPEGHPGTTRPEPEPTMTLTFEENTCRKCKAHLGKAFHFEKRIYEEIPEPQPIEVTAYLIGHYQCVKCGEITVADAPVPEGRFGPRTCAQVALLKFSDRLPHKLVVRALERQFSITMTPATVLDITRRVSDAVQDMYARLIQQVRQAYYVNVDETEMKVSGRTYYVWVFTTPDLTLYVIRPSRGQKVPEEILGADYAGVVVSDGWKVYTHFGTAQQRCWAHLLREAKQLASEHETAKGLYTGLKRMFEKLKEVLERPKWRENLWYERFVAEMRQWIDLAKGYRELRKFGTTLQNGLYQWFTCLLYPGVPPTNNAAERQLREVVVQRKIIGTLRTDKGATIMERIMSLLMTWQQQNINPLTALQKALIS
jgi:transposase